MYVLSQKLKTLKVALKDWHLKSFPNVDEAVVLARSKLATIQEDISNNALNGQRLRDEALANSEVAQAVQNQYLFWRDKAGVKWLTEFFHTYAKIRAAKSRISQLAIGGNMVSDEINLANHIVDYYKSLYSSAGNMKDPCPDGFPGSFYHSYWDVIKFDVIN